MIHKQNNARYTRLCTVW